MALARLPEEILLLVAVASTIDTIEALSRTCRHLRALLTVSKTVWRAVTRDLLAISPNPLLTRSLMHDTAESLRSHALRFQDVEKALSTREKLDLSDLDLSEIPASTIMTLPDTGCVIYQCDRACVYIVSLITHGVVDLWFPDIFMICRLSESSICTSTTHGLVMVFNGLVELEDEDRCRVWVFRIAPNAGLEPEYKLQLLMEYELPRLSNCLGVDVAGDTFMMLWDFAQDTEKLAIGTLDISSRTAGQSPIDICPITKTAAMKHAGDTCDLSALAHNIVVVAGYKEVSIFRLIDTSRAAPVPPCSAVAIPDGTYTIFGHHTRTAESVYLDVVTNISVHTLRITEDYTKIECTLAWADPAFLTPSDDVHLLLMAGPQRVSRYSRMNITDRVGPTKAALDSDSDSDSSDDSYKTLILATRPVNAHYEAERRLGSCMRKDFVMPLDGFHHIQDSVVSWDEWRGVGCMTLSDDVEVVGAVAFRL